MTPAEKQAMFEANMPLVKHIAGRYKCPREHFDDMLQEGYLALWRAICSEQYDPEKGAFSTYVGKLIQWAFADYTSKAMNRSGLTASADTCKRFQKAKSELKEVGDAITHNDLRQALGADDDTTIAAYALLSPAASLSISNFDDDDDSTFADACANITDTYDIDDTGEILRAAVDSLPRRLQNTIKLYYGIDCEPHNLKEIGEIEGRTGECIRQRINKGLDILRERIPVSLNWTL